MAKTKRITGGEWDADDISYFKSEYNAREQLIKTKEARRIHQEAREGFTVVILLIILVSAFASDRTFRDSDGNIIAMLNPASYWWHWRRGEKPRRACESKGGIAKHRGEEKQSGSLEGGKG